MRLSASHGGLLTWPSSVLLGTWCLFLHVQITSSYMDTCQTGQENTPNGLISHNHLFICLQVISHAELLRIMQFWGLRFSLSQQMLTEAEGQTLDSPPWLLWRQPEFQECPKRNRVQVCRSSSLGFGSHNPSLLSENWPTMMWGQQKLT